MITAQTTEPAARPAEPPLLLKVPQACERLNMTRSRLFAEIGSKRLRSVKVGRYRLIPVAELERYVARLMEAQNGGDAA